MIALEGKRHDDGSHSKQRIKGSYGTKVTRLVSDILDVCELGEKSLIFSQWDDMLVICEQALAENGVQFVRISSLKQIGDCTRRFREPDCSVMLLNVKNGTEGLTLVEATHVFMIEPLLNCGLDVALNDNERLSYSTNVISKLFFKCICAILMGRWCVDVQICSSVCSGIYGTVVASFSVATAAVVSPGRAVPAQ
jgi:hypothetical protein